MKYFCCQRFVLILLLLVSTLFGAPRDKSAIVYYGENISYPMVGVADYIIVQPELTNTKTHGFSLYKEKMYAYVSIGEIDKNVKEYAKVQPSWILAKNTAWSSEVLDIKNLEYQEYLFREMIEPRLQEGFKNFFFDTLDSYHLASKTKEEKAANAKALAAFIMLFHKKYPDAKLIINRGFEIIDEVHEAVEAVLFESYYKGIGGEKLAYKEVSDADRIWLDIQISKVKSYGLDVISLDYLKPQEMTKAPAIIEKIKAKGMIPYISNRELDLYGQSSKNAIKREILTLVDEGESDIVFNNAHRNGALVFEYMGYIQKLHDIGKGLPAIETMRHYAGVVIWLDYNYQEPNKLMQWIKSVKSLGVKVVFIGNFGIDTANFSLESLGIEIDKFSKKTIKILQKDKMMGFEIDPSLPLLPLQISSKNIKSLLTYANDDGTTNTPAAITEWGGYVIGESYILTMNKDNLWVVNPFEFFKQALRLEDIPVPDVTTENGNRLLFSHIDGDGIMNRVEGNSEHFSGEVILEQILKKYKIPHSASVIGAEIDAHGLYPELSQRLSSIAKEMYKLENVEGATHTFSHPYIWGEIKNDTLDEQYRLKIKDYTFSLEREISQTLNHINTELFTSNKPLAKTIFWSGDCRPRKNALEYIYAHDILNINGGDTQITRANPWLANIGPLGIERGDYYQVYTGAQNENVFTNNWLGPFWGFKKVVQTFELTNSPRRLKPIDIYYHMYSGSKMASVKALEYVFDWALQQDVMPIFTSEYIPKVMDFYTVSLAHDNNKWLVSGMRDVKTLRIEQKDAAIDFENSKTVVGLRHFENHSYISLDNTTEHIIKIDEKKPAHESSYMVSANAKIVGHIKEPKKETILFDGHVDLKLSFIMSGSCKLSSLPKATKTSIIQGVSTLEYKGIKKATLIIECK